MRLFVDNLLKPGDVVSVMTGRIGKNAQLYRWPYWGIARSYKDFVKRVENMGDVITHISFGFELDPPQMEMDELELANIYGYGFCEAGENVQDCYDCMVWMYHYYEKKGMKVPIILLHKPKSKYGSAMETLLKRKQYHEKLISEGLCTF